MSNVKTIEVEADVDLDEFEPHELAKSLIGRLDELDEADQEKILDELGYDDEYIQDQIKDHMILGYSIREIEDKIEYLPNETKFEYFIEHFDKITEEDLRRIVEG